AFLARSASSSSLSSPVAIRMTLTALPITSAGRFSPRGPRGISAEIFAMEELVACRIIDQKSDRAFRLVSRRYGDRLVFDPFLGGCDRGMKILRCRRLPVYWLVALSAYDIIDAVHIPRSGPAFR